VNPVLILTAVDLEARALARELELPLLRRFSFSTYGRDALRLAPVGLGQRQVLDVPPQPRRVDVERSVRVGPVAVEVRERAVRRVAESGCEDLDHRRILLSA